jgi:MSHA pilin protein MshD
MSAKREAVGCRLWAVAREEARDQTRAIHFRPTAYSLQPTAYSQRGVTLVELVISITVIAIAVSAVLGVLAMLSTGSADAMVRNQAVAVASAYLEEVRMKNYVSGGASASRTVFDDIDDYQGLTDVGARDQFGNAITGLEAYTVSVAVANTALNGVPMKRIDVNVQHSAGVNMTLSGYRAGI